MTRSDWLTKYVAILDALRLEAGGTYDGDEQQARTATVAAFGPQPVEKPAAFISGTTRFDCLPDGRIAISGGRDLVPERIPALVKWLGYCATYFEETLP